MSEALAGAVSEALSSEADAASAELAAQGARVEADAAASAADSAIASAHGIAAVAELTAAQIIAQNDQRIATLESELAECRSTMETYRTNHEMVHQSLDTRIGTLEAASLSLIPPREGAVIVAEAGTITVETPGEVGEVVEEIPAVAPRHRIRRL